MKAVELLRLYEAGRRDFSGESLRGQNFKGEDLSGADFRGADIRSANFSNANLTGASFTRAKAGLQRRHTLGLIFISLLLSIILGCLLAFAGFYIAVILYSYQGGAAQIAGWAAPTILIIFCFLTLRSGIGVVTGSFVFTVGIVFAFAIALGFAVARVVPEIDSGPYMTAGALEVVFAGAVASIIAFSVIYAGAVAVAGVYAGLLTVMSVVSVALVVSVAVSFPGGFSVSLKVIVAISVLFSVVSTLLSSYIGLRALRGDPRDAWIRSTAVAFAAISGTSFRGSMLTDADFSHANLKSADFRRAQLIRTYFQGAENLDRVRPGNTYLNSSKIQHLLLTGNGQGQSFKHLLNLSGINLQGASLVKADFTGSTLKGGNLQGANLANALLIGTNLNSTNLKDVNLSNAKLVQAQLDHADLRGSTLTGAYIEAWNITTKTKLNGISCDYVYMRLPAENDSDDDLHRKPDNRHKTFADGEFFDFIAPMVETLDLYHNQIVDPRALAIAFNNLREQNPDADIEIISMEKRGQQRDKFLLRAETNKQANLSELSATYFNCYDELKALPSVALQALVAAQDRHIQMLAGMVGTAIDRPSTQINKNYQGDTTVSEQGSNAPKYDMRGTQFAGGFAETVQGNMEGGTINNNAAEMPSLAEAAAEIQDLLKQLEASNPNATEAEQTAYLSAMIPPTRRERFIGALRAASGAAIEEVPYGMVLKALVEGWQRPNG